MKRTREEVLTAVKALAVEYWELAGKPLGVTGEIGEFEAAKIVGLKLEEARSKGYDAIRQRGIYRQIQIKSRWRHDGKRWGRVPTIDISKEFDSVMLVLMHRNYEVHEIWEAGRDAVIARLKAPGSKARNERGSMGVSQFKSIAEKIWPN